MQVRGKGCHDFQRMRKVPTHAHARWGFVEMCYFCAPKLASAKKGGKDEGTNVSCLVPPSHGTQGHAVNKASAPPEPCPIQPCSFPRVGPLTQRTKLTSTTPKHTFSHTPNANTTHAHTHVHHESRHSCTPRGHASSYGFSSPSGGHQLRARLPARRYRLGLHDALYSAGRARPQPAAAPAAGARRCQGQRGEAARVRGGVCGGRLAAQPAVRCAAVAQPDR